MDVYDIIALIAFLVIWYLLVRVVFPRFGVPT